MLDDGRTRSGRTSTPFSANDLKALGLDKKTDGLVAEAEKLHEQIDRYAYGPPTFRFADVDQARAASVLIELDRNRSSPTLSCTAN